MTVQRGFRGNLDDALGEAETLRDTLDSIRIEDEDIERIYNLVDDACSRLSNLAHEHRDDPPQPGL